MKKLVLITVFFLVSVFSFGQSSFTTNDLNFSFNNGLIEEADYNVKTNNFENNKIQYFDIMWTERVIYSYKDKYFKICGPLNCFEYEDAYVRVDDSSNFISYYYVYCLAKPEGKDPYWIKMVEISKSGENGRYILTTNVIDKDGNYVMKKE